MAQVLIVSDLWLPFPGGAERMMYNIARHLLRRGHDVHVLTGYENAQQFDGAPFTQMSLGVHDQRDEGAAAVSAFIAERRPDVIITQLFYASQFGAELVASGAPVVHLVHNGTPVEGAALVAYNSRWGQQHCGGGPDTMVVSPPAFDDVVADTHGDAIGFIKPIEHKGVAMVNAIAAALPERRFVILRGEWQDIEVITDLPNVTYMEPVVDIRTFYAECRLLLMPSLSEDAGTVGQEAAANGLPCISSNVGGLPETNGGGILLPPDDLGAWLAAIALLDDPAAYQATVMRQFVYQAEHDERGELDAFADAVEALCSRS